MTAMAAGKAGRRSKIYPVVHVASTHPNLTTFVACQLTSSLLTFGFVDVGYFLISLKLKQSHNLLSNNSQRRNQANESSTHSSRRCHPKIKADDPTTRKRKMLAPNFSSDPIYTFQRTWKGTYPMLLEQSKGQRENSCKLRTRENS
jgi:hypothetical protein